MWDLPGPGLKPVSSALAGGFLTTAPPGKSCLFLWEEFSASLVADLAYGDCLGGPMENGGEGPTEADRGEVLFMRRRK